MANVLEVETDGRLRVLRLNRHERKNALNGPLFGAITDAVRDAAHDDGVWAVALTGNGDAFCSGLDLNQDDAGPSEPRADDAADEDEDDRIADNMAMVMRVECEKPIVAGINGVAVGIGVSLAMAADIRIAAPSARFHPGYARVATSPDGGGTWTVTQALGYERAMRFYLESRMVPAAEALQVGLVSEVTATDEELGERLLDYGRQLAAVAPIASQQTKRMLGRIARPADVAGHLREEVRLALHGLASADSARAVRAMATREQPEFEGR
jgi:enoyl-CoA hydratase/carnithine racemase